MSSIKTSLLLRTDIDTAFKITLKALLIMGVEVKSAVKESIKGEHGSYWAFSPDKLRKDIKVILNKINDEVNVSIEVRYDKYLILSILSGLFGLIVGLVLYQSVRDSLEYLNTFAVNPFIVLFEKPPWLLKHLIDWFDIDLTNSSHLSILKDYLKLLEYLSILIIFASLTEFWYAYFSYKGAVKFANQLLDHIRMEYSRILKSSTAAIKTSSKKDASKFKERTRSKGLIRCTKMSSRMIQCTAENINIDSVLKALTLFGFMLHEVDKDIYVGKKDGSTWATNITGYKLKARVVRVSESKIIIMIELLSLLGEFSDKDVLKLNEFLNKIF